MRIRDLEARVPHISSEAIVDFWSNINVNKDHIAYRPRRTFFQELFESVSGKKWERQNQIDRNLTSNQELLFKYAESLLDRQRISDVALRLTQERLLETRRFIRSFPDKVDSQEEKLHRLVSRFERFESNVVRRLEGLEGRIQRLDAIDVVTDVVESWESGATYHGMPFLVQLNFVAAEVIGRVGTLKLRKKRVTDEVRDRFVNKAVVVLSQKKNSYHIQQLLRSQISLLKEVDLEMAVALIDPRAMEYCPEPTPLRFCLGTTLEICQRKPRVMGDIVDRSIGLTEEKGMEVQRVYSLRQIVRMVFDENLKQVFHRARVLEVA